MTIDTKALEAALNALRGEKLFMLAENVRALIRSHAEKVKCERPIDKGANRPSNFWIPCGECDPCLIFAINRRLP